jgi:hypothetical protein
MPLLLEAPRPCRHSGGDRWFVDETYVKSRTASPPRSPNSRRPSDSRRQRAPHRSPAPTRQPPRRRAGRTELLAGIEQRAFLDIDSLPRPVCGHAKQGASDGHTKIAGKQVLRRGLSPLATTSSAENAEPVIAGMRLVLGKIYDSTLTPA